MPDDNSNDQSDMGMNESGYSIPLKKEEVVRFFEEGDFTSGKYIGLFENVGSELNDKIRGANGASFLALSVTDDRISRNFSVLQLAHYLSRLDRKVLIVDCDFLEPGLDGLVDNIEEYGFLDLLLYGSSLKSVAKSSGIDNVGIIGPGSFPVTKTVPFARKEFKRVNSFLLENADAVIYCSTLKTDEGEINPLSEFVDGIILSCRLEETEEGELQKSVSGLESIGVRSIETVCLCRGGSSVPVREEPEEVESGREEEAEGAGETAVEEMEEAQEKEEKVQEEVKEAEEVETGFIEKTEELESEYREPGKKFDVFRLVAIIVGVLMVAFLVWWFMINKGIQKDDSSMEIKREAVRKMKDVREEVTEEGESGTGEAGAVAEETDQRSGRTSGPEENGVREEEKPVEKVTKYYTVHVASFRDPGRAEREKEYFEKLGYEARVRETEIKEQKWYRIMIGRFRTEEEAGEKRLELKGLEKVGYARVREIEID